MPYQKRFKDRAQEKATVRMRIASSIWVILVLFVILIVRLYYLQVSQHDYYQDLSNHNRIATIPINPPRGLIYDRNGKLLAENIPSHSLELFPREVKTKNIQPILDGLAKIVTLSKEEQEEILHDWKTNHYSNSLLIHNQLTPDEIARFSVNKYQYPGVKITTRFLRHYPYDELYAHSIGYVGRINEAELKQISPENYRASHYIGKIGIEQYYEEKLHGQTGKKWTEVDARGKAVRVLQTIPPIPGTDLYLTIDSELQAAADKLLYKHGAIVALDPQTGDILAMVSKPSYDPNSFVGGISNFEYQVLNLSPTRPLYNRVLRGQYPPASTVKPLMALGGLDYQLITPKFQIHDPGWFQLPGESHMYRDWKKQGHGVVDLHRAIVQSCDTYFFTLAHKMGIVRIHDFLTKFGYGQTTMIDLNGELPGVLPSPEWKRRARRQPWFPGETLSVGIGQGFLLATPLQMAVAVGTIANHGKRVIPHLLHAEKLSNGSVINYETKFAEPVTLSDPSYWDLIIGFMRGVVMEGGGTARLISNGLQYTIAGKTGTAQVFTVNQNEQQKELDKQKQNRIENLRDHSLFIGFAPVEDPKIAVAVIVEHGSTLHPKASEIARQVMDAYLLPKIKNITPQSDQKD